MLSLSKRLLRSDISCQLRKLSTATLPPHKETKLKVLDAEINVIESTESSSNAPPIFFLPGALGSIEMDFKPIFHEMNTEKYKWISWDPPGYGKSIPPKRDFVSKTGLAVNEQDVKYIKELMNIFGYPKYTLLSWSGAALSGIIISNEQPEKVSALITWGAFGYVAEEMMPKMRMMRTVGLAAIPEPRKSQLLKMYGEEYLLEMWNGWGDEGVVMYDTGKFTKGGAFEKFIKGVQCPTLIIHGKKDQLINVQQAHDLNKHIKNSRVHLMDNGTHNLHLRETKEFIKLVQQFADETNAQTKKQ